MKILVVFFISTCLFSQGLGRNPVRLSHDGIELSFVAPLAHPRDAELPQPKPKMEDGIAMLGSYELTGGQMPLLEVGVMKIPEQVKDLKGFCLWLSKKLSLKEGDPKQVGQFSYEVIANNGTEAGALFVRRGVMDFSGAPVPSLTVMFVKLQQGRAFLFSITDLDEHDPMKLLPSLKGVANQLISSVHIGSVKQP
jgi:hypothetical protein